jgi:MFS family permease
VGLIVGATLYAFMAFGVVMFFPSYMIRSLGVSLTEVGTVYGSIGAAGALLGTLGGGWMADRLGRSNVAWYREQKSRETGRLRQASIRIFEWRTPRRALQ